MTTGEELVERVARAIGEANETNFTVVSFPNCNWIAEARAAIAAMNSPLPLYDAAKHSSQYPY